MIGNDIVDLRLARYESDWQRKGWLQKICTKAEQYHILNAENPELLVWEYWSRKEATYKAHQRRFPFKPKYNPVDYECVKNRVNIEGFSYVTKTQCTQDWVYSIASIVPVKYTSLVLDDYELARKGLVRFVSETFSVDPTQVSIFKDTYRIPHLIINSVIKDLNFSITNHGLFSAFIIDL
ncbi:4'-phosphopantetheinyl transferase superfamily protein [Aquimarina sp. AU474]|uniref:4'-phosphopantetheinyl transferase family protein n=1 Tax=Aquimarina sp. AU474 TaxID=2108529 RepID=UPI000D686515|nr:4'-phosphopantetheinyl transferase superfamily protein [Aquimarina sp. AU474]